MGEYLRARDLGDEVVVAGVILVIVRVDDPAERLAAAKCEKRLSQAAPRPWEAGVDEQRVIDEIRDRVIVTAADTAQEPGDRVVDADALHTADRLRDGRPERHEGIPPAA